MHSKRIGEILQKQDLVIVSPATTVAEAVRLMASRHVGAVLITEGDALKGIFTERDLVERVVAAGRDTDSTPVSAVMTPRPVTISPKSTVREALRAMKEWHMRHLPVMRDGTIIGIVSARDFMAEEVAEVGW